MATQKQSLADSKKMFSITIYKEGEEQGQILVIDPLSQCSDFIIRKVQKLKETAMALSCNFRCNLEHDKNQFVTGVELYWDNNGIERTHRIIVQEYK